MKRKSLLAMLMVFAGFQVYQAQAQTTFDGININNGQNLVFKGFSNGVNDPTDAGDVVFQKANGDELTRIRSLYDTATGLASICFSSSPLINATFLFTGEGNLGIGNSVPKTRLEVQPPIGNISTGVFHSTGGQSYGHVLALATDNPTGDDPKLLFSYRNRAKQWALGGNYNTSNFNILEDGGDGSYGTGFGIARMTVIPGGNVGIGTSNPQAKLAVEGNILAKEIKVKTDINVPDYVFEPDYDLKSLEEIESYVKANKHLPEIPSAKQIQTDGLDLAEMNLLLLKKVEEMTLQLIQMNNEMKKQAEKIEKQEDNIKQIKRGNPIKN
ncbi:hypothetical protein [Sphingobacterium sp.]|uniref:hypothetical protein n=1 Tax=Sphingobacterium sp. TaxID=341027 RepID=UPI0031E00C93